MSNSKSEKIEKRIYGVVKRKYFRELDIYADGKSLTLRRLHRPAFLNYVSPVDNKNVFKTLGQWALLRKIILTVTRNPGLLVPGQWCSLEIVYPNLSAGLPLTISAKTQIQSLNVFVSRDVARLGIHPNRYDQGLEYMQRRDFDNFDLFLTWGFAANQEFRIPGRKINGHNFVQDFWHTYFPEFNNLCSQYSIERKLVSGPFSNLPFSTPPSSHRYFQNWTYLLLNNAMTYSAEIIADENCVYFLDRSRIPEYSHSGTSWPNSIKASYNGTIFLPKFSKEFEFIEIAEAVFIGSTNNWMHFVLEDIPRFYLLHLSGIPKNIPVILRSELSQQIRETISCLTDRELIFVNSEEEIQVKRLHGFEFNNQLLSAASGEMSAESVLVSKVVIDWAISRIHSNFELEDKGIQKLLVRREAGLFRPLVNSGEVWKFLTQKMGFKSTYLSGLHLNEVVELFWASNVLVAEFGAGLGNLIFLPPNSRVVEIRGPLESNSLEYEFLARTLGHNHSVLIGTRKLLSKNGLVRGPYKIKIRKLSKMLA